MSRSGSNNEKFLLGFMSTRSSGWKSVNREGLLIKWKIFGENSIEVGGRVSAFHRLKKFEKIPLRENVEKALMNAELSWMHFECK